MQLTTKIQFINCLIFSFSYMFIPQNLSINDKTSHEGQVIANATSWKNKTNKSAIFRRVSFKFQHKLVWRNTSAIFQSYKKYMSHMKIARFTRFLRSFLFSFSKISHESQPTFISTTHNHAGDPKEYTYCQKGYYILKYMHMDMFLQEIREYALLQEDIWHII